MSYDPMAKIAAERERDRRAECFDDLLAALREMVEVASREAESIVIGGNTARTWLARSIRAWDLAKVAIAKAEGKQ